MSGLIQRLNRPLLALRWTSKLGANALQLVQSKRNSLVIAVLNASWI